MKRHLPSMSAALALVAISQTACWAQPAFDVKVVGVGVNEGGTHAIARIVNMGPNASPRFEYTFVGAFKEGTRTAGDFIRGGFAPPLKPGEATIIKADAATFVENNLGKTVSVSVRLKLADGNAENNYSKQFFILPRTVKQKSAVGVDLSVKLKGNKGYRWYADVTNVGSVKSGEGRRVAFYYKTSESGPWIKREPLFDEAEEIGARFSREYSVLIREASPYAVKVEVNAADNDPSQNDSDMKVLR